MSTSIDPTVYLRQPRFDVPSGIALGKMLRAARPEGLPPPAQQAAEQLDASVTSLEGAWHESERTSPREASVQRCDKRLDNVWAAVRGRLVAHGCLSEEHPRRVQAERIDALLFPNGLSFLKSPYLVQHSESERRLALIGSEGIADDLHELVGPLFVDELRAAHGEYGRALGITAPAETKAPARVGEPFRAMQAALRGYALQLVAYAATSPAALEAVRAGLRPLDAFRAASERRASRGGVAEPEPSEPGGEGDAGEPGDADEGGEPSEGGEGASGV
ncbi:MAG: hypothetical protein MUF34_32220 [Polyangiaceae bacterium]|nr:hypothetical protein [Polyangiaceae bacterium]